MDVQDRDIVQAHCSEAEQTLAIRNSQIIACRRCPRLVAWREHMGREKRKSYAGWEYWAKPVPDFGDPEATHLIVGLAPAAHGANRTGQMFTGDRSGAWLYRALHKAGVASLPKAESIEDGLTLKGVLISATCHCAPPDNKPTSVEMDNCRPYMRAVLASRPWESILCLGGIAWGQVMKLVGQKNEPFGHAASYVNSSGLRIVGSYHPSQQNTFTGRLTETMLDDAVRLFLGR